MKCWNCKDELRGNWRAVRTCPVCIRTYGYGAFIGGLLVGALLKLIG